MNESKPLTLNELKQRLDAFVGMTSVITKGTDTAEFTYRTPTGLTAFELHATRSNLDSDGWRFGGSTHALPENWTRLCRIHKD